MSSPGNNDGNQAGGDANGSRNQSPSRSRHGTVAELEWLRAHVPQAFDRFDLFDPNRASHLVRHGLVPAYAVSTLNDRIQREANATYRPVPDLFDRRLAYQPGPGAMSGLDRRNVNMGSAGGAMRSVSVPRPEASSYRPQSSSSRAVVPSFSAPAPNRPSARPGPTSDRPWTEADTDLLFRLRAQHVGFKDCAAYFSGRTEKSAQEKFYKTKAKAPGGAKWDEACKKYGGHREGSPPPPPPPPAAPAV